MSGSCLPSCIVDICEAFARAFDRKPKSRINIQEANKLLTIQHFLNGSLRMLFLRTDGSVHVQDGLGEFSSSFVIQPYFLDCLTNLNIYQEFHIFNLERGIVAGNKGTFTRQENFQWLRAEVDIPKGAKLLNDHVFVSFTAQYVHLQSCHTSQVTHLRAKQELECVRSLGVWNDCILAGLVDGNVAMWQKAGSNYEWKTLVCATTRRRGGGDPVHLVASLNNHRWLSASQTCICLWNASNLVVLFENPAEEDIISAIGTSDGQVIVQANNKKTWLLNPFVRSDCITFMGYRDYISSLPDGRVIFTCWRVFAANMEVTEYL